MRLTLKHFLIKAVLLLALAVGIQVLLSFIQNRGADPLYHVGFALAALAFVPVASVLPGLLAWGGLAMIYGKDNQDLGRIGFLLGIYLVVLWVLYDRGTLISEAMGEDLLTVLKQRWVLTLWLVLALLYALPWYDLNSLKNSPEEEAALDWKSKNRWMIFGLVFAIIFVLLIFIAAPILALQLTAGIVLLIMLPFFVFDIVTGRLAYWKLPWRPGHKSVESSKVDWDETRQHLIQQQDWVGLKAHATEWLKIARENAESWGSLGWAQFKLGEYGESVKSFVIATKLNPKRAFFLFALGLARENLGQHDYAVALYTKALILEPNNQDIRQALDRATRKMNESDNDASGVYGNNSSRSPENNVRYYHILELSPGATVEEIKATYRRLMQQYHPDKVSRLGRELRELAERKTKEINEAYRTLIDAAEGN